MQTNADAVTEAQGDNAHLPPCAPSQFTGSRAPPRRLVIASTFDPLGIEGPLHVWLSSLTGLCAQVSWVGYGMVISGLRDRESVWNANASGLNVLLLRWSDLRRESCADGAGAPQGLLDALRLSCAVRRGPTLVVIPPTTEAIASSSTTTTTTTSGGGGGASVPSESESRGDGQGLGNDGGGGGGGGSSDGASSKGADDAASHATTHPFWTASRMRRTRPEAAARSPE